LEEIYRVLKPGGQLVMCDAGKANYLHGLAGRIWMSTMVQLMARWVTKSKDHPWKGLARSYTHYGTNKYYRTMMKEVGFQDVSGRLLYPFLMSSRFRGRKPQ
jgi:ubiquinone/menaquinone biosynthesis C-methylase UbiE